MTDQTPAAVTADVVTDIRVARVVFEGAVANPRRTRLESLLDLTAHDRSA